MSLPRVLKIMLWPLSVVYGWAARLRAWLYTHGWLKQKRLNASVVSVGNLTVGGTGKTPMVVWLAEKLLADGKRVAILSRGYHGNGVTSDEIELMKARLHGRVLFGVGSNRYVEGQLLEPKGVDIFLLDDGFQHLQLARDFDIVLIDSTRPLGDQALLPAGALREPVSAVNRANLVLFTRANHATGAICAIHQLPQLPVFRAWTRLAGWRPISGNSDSTISMAEAHGPFYAFCGIGNPEAFWRDLQEWKVPVTGHSKFRDHHRYTPRDIAELEQRAAQSGAKGLVTTEKDEQNLGNLRFSRLAAYVSVITLEIPDEEEVLRRIKSKIYSHRGVAA